MDFYFFLQVFKLFLTKEKWHEQFQSQYFLINGHKILLCLQQEKKRKI